MHCLVGIQDQNYFETDDYYYLELYTVAFNIFVLEVNILFWLMTDLVKKYSQEFIELHSRSWNLFKAISSYLYVLYGSNTGVWWHIMDIYVNELVVIFKAIELMVTNSSCSVIFLYWPGLHAMAEKSFNDSLWVSWCWTFTYVCWQCRHAACSKSKTGLVCIWFSLFWAS